MSRPSHASSSSVFVPRSMSRRGRPPPVSEGRSMPHATAAATRSPPTWLRTSGKTSTGARGSIGRPVFSAVSVRTPDHAAANGARPRLATGTPRHKCIIVGFPATAARTTWPASQPASAFNSSTSAASPARTAFCRCTTPSGESSVRWMREITSAPNAACGFSDDADAATDPSESNTRAAASDVVPTSTARPNRGRPSAEGAAATGWSRASGGRSSPNDLPASDRVTAGTSMTDAASRTSWQPRRHPAPSSAGVKIARSASDGGAAPSITRTPQRPHVAREPHGCSRRMPAAAAAR